MLAIGCQVIPLSIDDSQRRTVPNCPESVICPPLLPEQTSAGAEVVPPIGALSMVIVTTSVLGGHAAVPVIDHWNW